MPSFQIVEGKVHHCGPMARILRREQREPLLKANIPIHRALRNQLEASSYRRAWLIDGRLAGLGGVHGTLASPDGIIWLTLSEDALRYRKAIVAESKRQIDLIMGNCRKLIASTLWFDWRAAEFAAFLGFEEQEPIVEDGIAYSIWMLSEGTAVKTRRERRQMRRAA